MPAFQRKIKCLLIFFLIAFAPTHCPAQLLDAQTFAFDATTITDTAHFRFLSYYIDKGANFPIDSVAQKFQSGAFNNFTTPSLNIGLNPYPLWIAFSSHYTGAAQKTYWWSFYTHADSIFVYQADAHNRWQLGEILSFKKHISERPEPVRSLSVSLNYKPGEKKLLLAKVVHLRNPQNFVTSFTTPKSHLLWERNFYWTVGVFVGLSLMVFIYSVIVGFFSLRKIFFIYASYLLAITLLCLSEELLSPMLPEPVFRFMVRMSDLHLVVLCLCLSFYTIAEIVGIRRRRQAFSKIVGFTVNISLIWALVSGIFHFAFFDAITVSDSFFIFSWNVGLILIVLLNICIAATLIASARKKTFYLNIIAALLLLYFNAGGYFLNYEGIFKYYEITYPNVYYWMLLLEYIVLGAMLSWQYTRSVRKQKELANQKAKFETVIYQRELAAEKRERQKLAQELHDELATDLSAIRLFVSNNYSQDTYLQQVVSKANVDVRKFLNRLADRSIYEKGIVASLQEKLAQLNALQLMHFEFYTLGDDTKIPREDYIDLFWIAHELLFNILKHAHAQEATIQLIIDDEQYTLMTEDNGIGIEKDEKHTGMGLKNIQARAGKINAQLHFVSNKNGTTTILTKSLSQ